jgi:RNA polymerase sigma factor (TIGR02999 family)
MSSQEPSDVSRILVRLASEGGPVDSLLNELYTLIYGELHRMAGALMVMERGDHTLTPTGLVHEAFIRLAPLQDKDWNGRAHFFSAAARAMRRVLVDHSRRRAAAKRGGDWQRVTLSDTGIGAPNAAGAVELDEALTRLALVDDRAARVAELKIFAGLPMRELAGILEVSKRTADSDWAFARSWLSRELSSGD